MTPPDMHQTSPLATDTATQMPHVPEPNHRRAFPRLTTLLLVLVAPSATLSCAAKVHNSTGTCKGSTNDASTYVPHLATGQHPKWRPSAFCYPAEIAAHLTCLEVASRQDIVLKSESDNAVEAGAKGVNVKANRKSKNETNISASDAESIATARARSIDACSALLDDYICRADCEDSDTRDTCLDTCYERRRKYAATALEEAEAAKVEAEDAKVQAESEKAAAEAEADASSQEAQDAQKKLQELRDWTDKAEAWGKALEGKKIKNGPVISPLSDPPKP